MQDTLSHRDIVSQSLFLFLILKISLGGELNLLVRGSCTVSRLSIKIGSAEISMRTPDSTGCSVGGRYWV